MNRDRYIAKIAKADLIHGEYYKGRCRNASVARWNGEIQKFIHWRVKFGQWFTEEICHPEDEKYWDVFIVEEVCAPEKEIPFK